MSRMTRSMLILSIGVAFLCLLVFWQARHEYWPTYYERSGGLGGYSYFAIWRDTESGRKLNKLILMPRRVEASLAMMPTSLDNENLGRMIYMSPTRLKVWNEVVDTSVHRVFVFSDGNDLFAMLPIELTDDELRSITPEGIDAVPATEMWKQKILPALTANEGKRKPTGNRHGELVRGPRISIPNAKLKKAAPTIK